MRSENAKLCVTWAIKLNLYAGLLPKEYLMPSNCSYFCRCFQCQKRETETLQKPKSQKLKPEHIFNWCVMPLPGTGYRASWCRNHCSHSRCGCVDHWYHLQMQGYSAAMSTKPVPRDGAKMGDSKFTNHTPWQKMIREYLDYSVLNMCNEEKKLHLLG